MFRAAGPTADLLLEQEEIGVGDVMDMMMAGRAGVATLMAAGLAAVAVMSPPIHPAAATARSLPSGPLYGITIDDVSNIGRVVSSVEAMPYMPTTQVYLDPTEPASYYQAALEQLAPHSYIMGEILDSSDMKAQTVQGEQARVSSLLSTLGPSVDIWEIGNEVNGNWTGPYSQGAQMVVDTYHQVAAAGYKSALTLYENSWGPDHCGDGASELTPQQYSSRYLPASVRDGINYVLLSWYPTQCAGLSGNVAVSTITSEVQALHLLYPNASIGFGELGLPNPTSASSEARAQQIMAYYYGAPVHEPYYIGGGFWWYWDEDLSLPGMPAALNSAFDAEHAAIGDNRNSTGATTSPAPAPVSATAAQPVPATPAVPVSPASSQAVHATASVPVSATVVQPTSTTPVVPVSPTSSQPVHATTPVPAAPTPGVAPAGAQVPVSPEAFSAMGPASWTDGQTRNTWTDQWNGYGSARTTVDPTANGYVASLAPAVATSPSLTHSALLTTSRSYTSPTFSVAVRTVEQLRRGSAPNPWEVGWVLWDFNARHDSFYALVLKPNGWELDKEIDGREFFIATGSSPVFPIGRWYDVSVSQSGSQISVSVNGAHLVSATDSSLQSGAIGLYCEDSVAHFGNVTLP